MRRGRKDLSDDIGHYAQETNGGAAAAELSRRIAEALKGKNIKAGAGDAGCAHVAGWRSPGVS